MIYGIDVYATSTLTNYFQNYQTLQIIINVKHIPTLN